MIAFGDAFYAMIDKIYFSRKNRFVDTQSAFWLQGD